MAEKVRSGEKRAGSRRRHRESQKVEGAPIHLLSGVPLTAAIETARDQNLAPILVLRLGGDSTPPSEVERRTLLDTLLTSPKPVVAVVDGHLAGVGLLIACLADLRVASPRSTFSWSVDDLAPDIGRAMSAVLSDMVGTARLVELLTSASLTANWAQEIGLFNHLAAEQAAVNWAFSIGEMLAEEQRLAIVRAAKKIVLEGVSGEEDPSHMPAAVHAGNGEMKQRILDAAAAVLARQGYRGCRLSDIAAEIGVHQTTIYHYFSSKDALVQAVLQDGLIHAYEVMTSAVESLSTEADPLERLATAMRAHLVVTLESSDFSAAAMRLQTELSPQLLKGLRAIQRRYGAYWSDLFEQARDVGLIREDIDLSVARSFVAGALNSAIEWYKPNKLTVKQIADEFVAVALAGLASEEARERGLVPGSGGQR